ncbi:MAG: hypothetical protein NUW37_19125 [Planctomycetes bacterium]|nr:hypothetical protein [Planctomycetota bacterium]
MALEWFRLLDGILPLIKTGELDYAVCACEAALCETSESPFRIALECDFTNPPEDVAAHIAEFISRESSKFEIKCLYAETCALLSNPGRWFFNLYAYDKQCGDDYYDWLAYFASDPFPEFTLIGMEKLQEVYASDAIRDENLRAQSMICDAIVLTKFQRLMQRAAPLIEGLQVPLLASVYDMDFIFEYRSNK